MGPGPPSLPFGPGTGAGGSLGRGGCLFLKQLEASLSRIEWNISRTPDLWGHRLDRAWPENFAILPDLHFGKVVFRIYESCEKSRGPQIDIPEYAEPRRMVYIYLPICVSMHLCIHASTHLCIHVFMHTCIYPFI